MKRHFSVFLICLWTSIAWSQPGLYPLERNDTETSHARTSASTPFVDTLKLPFVHDFFTTYYPIDHIDNTPASSSPVSFTSLRFHGLKDGDAVEILFVSPTISGLVGKFFVDVTSNFSFDLYVDQALADPFERTGVAIPYMRVKKLGVSDKTIPVIADTLAFYDNNGGALVSPNYALNAISYYNATFDGLKANGEPYNTSNSLAVGYTDNLTSQPINMKGNVAADNIHMSFFYQNAGLGDVADLNDKLFLEFLDSNGIWSVAWSMEGTNVPNSDTFYIAMVPITDEIFLYKGFQFRFRSYGRQSGSYDVWNVTQLYINTGRSGTGLDHRDFCISKADQSILKNYTAMPYRHFFTNQSLFLNNTLTFQISNQSSDSKLRTYRFFLSDHLGTPQNSFTSKKVDGANDTNWKFNYSCPLDTTTFLNQNQPLYINQRYAIIDTQLADYNIPIDFMHNNELSLGTVLHDYYAYDDNTAEAAFGSNSAGSKIAVQFKSETKDTLTHIDIAYVQSKGPNVNGLKIILNVWSADRTIVRRTQIITIKYSESINGFERYRLAQPLILQTGEVFHIGYQQNFNSLMTLGYDRNNDHTNKVFYNTNGNWLNLNNQPGIEKGSVMIRPVFSKGETLVTDIIDPQTTQKKTLELYPNPASERVTVISQQPLNYQVYSLFGQLMDTGILSAESNNNTLSVSNYGSGMYIILCTDQSHNTYVGRFIKE